MLGGYQRNSYPEYCIGDLKRLLRLLDLYQWCSGVHPIGVPKHIRLYGGGKTSYIPQYPQGRVLRGPWCRKNYARFGRGKGIQPKNGSSDEMDYN